MPDVGKMKSVVQAPINVVSVTQQPVMSMQSVLQGGGGGGTSDYTDLTNKPQIEGVTLSDNKTADDLGLAKSTDIPSPSSATPQPLGTAAAGSSGDYARADHVHAKPTAADVGAVSDVQVNGTSVVTDGVAKVPVASSSAFGVVSFDSDGAFSLSGANKLLLNVPSDGNIKGGTVNYKAIVVSKQHQATFYGLAKAAGDSTQSASENAVGTYTETALSKIHDMLNAPVSVSGSTPSITAMAGVRYVCGEVSTVAVQAPASGCIDVVFESGSTPTVLTVTSAKSGVTAIKWANGWDGMCEANTVYEINILDGEFGVVAAWT